MASRKTRPSELKRTAVDLAAVPPAVVQYLVRQHEERMVAAVRLAQWSLQETRPVEPRRKELRVRTAAYWYAATPAARRILSVRYKQIQRAAGDVLVAEMARRRRETLRTLTRLDRALTAMDRAADGIPEHAAVALLTFVEAARCATTDGDVERLNVADDLVEEYAAPLRAKAAVENKVWRDNVRYKPKRRVGQSLTTTVRNSKEETRLRAAQAEYLSLRGVGIPRSQAVSQVLPVGKDRGNFTRWLKVRKLEQRLKTDPAAGLLVESL